MNPEESRRHLKYLKWQLVASGLLFWGGVVWMFFGLVEVGRTDKEAGSELLPQLIVCGIGFFWYLMVRVRLWMLNE